MDISKIDEKKILMETVDTINQLFPLITEELEMVVDRKKEMDYDDSDRIESALNGVDRSIKWIMNYGERNGISHDPRFIMFIAYTNGTLVNLLGVFELYKKKREV